MNPKPYIHIPIPHGVLLDFTTMFGELETVRTSVLSPEGFLARCYCAGCTDTPSSILTDDSGNDATATEWYPLGSIRNVVNHSHVSTVEGCYFMS